MSKNKESVKIEFTDRINNAKISIGGTWPQVLGKELIKMIGEFRFINVNGEEGQKLLESTKILIEAKVDFTVSNNKGVTALSMASSIGNIELVELLIEQGADINQKDLEITPLMFSCLTGNFPLTKFLIEQNADVNLENIHSCQSIDFSVINSVNKNITQLLLEKGAKIIKPLTSARLFECFSEDLEMFKLLVDHGMKFYDQKIANNTLESYLKEADQGDEKTQEYFKCYIKMGAAFNTREDANQWLKCYFNKDDVEMVPYILSAKYLQKTSEIKTYSFDKLGKEVISVRTIGANVNLVIDEKSKDTLLHKAIKNNNKDMVTVLLKFGANYNTKNLEGDTSFSLAKDLESKEIAEILDWQLYNDTHHYSESPVLSFMEYNVNHLAHPNDYNIPVKTSGDFGDL